MTLLRFALAAGAGLAMLPAAGLAQTAAPAAPAAPAAAPALPPSPHLVANGNIVSTLQGSGQFTVLVKALAATGLSDTLKAAPGLTVFAPTDAAFNALPPARVAALMAPANAPVLQKILTYHVVNLSLDSSKIKGAKGPVPSVEGSKLQLDGSGAAAKVDNADIIQADVRASNGIIHVIDKVLLPPDVALPAATADAGGTPYAGR